MDTAILGMHNQGLTTRQIESILGTIDHSTIAAHLKSLTPTKTSQIYRELKADILSEKQLKILQQSDLVIGNARDQRDYATSYGIYYDKERLERGQSTENISYPDYNRAFEQIREERQRLARELGIEDTCATIEVISDDCTVP